MADEPKKGGIAKPDLVSLASLVGGDWTNGEYYDWAEKGMDSQWNKVIWPIISESDFSNVVEIAAGHGRNTAKLIDISDQLTATDINESNVQFLQNRFGSAAKVRILQNNGADLRAISGGSISLVYCWDAMVHFDSDIVRAYLAEIRRVLQPGGRAFCHFSSFDKEPAGTYRDHPGWRNFMSRALFEHWLAKEGMRPLKCSYLKDLSELTDDPECSDCVCYFELPSDAPAGDKYTDQREIYEALAAEATSLRKEVSSLREALHHSETSVDPRQTRPQVIDTSLSWRMTQPLRRLLANVGSKGSRIKTYFR
jgi:ubiquinone/menaquinone biosynthesis C-methylase UbiE